jgi:hypothetical protein
MGNNYNCNKRERRECNAGVRRKKSDTREEMILRASFSFGLFVCFFALTPA